MAFNVFNSSRFPSTFGGTFQLPTDEEQPSWMNFSKAKNVPSVPNMSSVASPEKQSFDPSSLPSKYGKLDFSAISNQSVATKKFNPSDYGTSFDTKYMKQAISDKTVNPEIQNPSLYSASKSALNTQAGKLLTNALTPSWMKEGASEVSNWWNKDVSEQDKGLIKQIAQSEANPFKRMYESKSLSDPIKAFYDSPDISDSEKSVFSGIIKQGMNRAQAEEFLTQKYSKKDVINEAIKPGFGENLFTAYAKPLTQLGVGAANIFTNEKLLEKGNQHADFNDFWKLGSGIAMTSMNVAAPVASGAFNVFGSTSAGEATLSNLPGQMGVGAVAGYATGGLKGALIGAGVGAIPEGIKMVTENTPYLSDAVNSLTPSGQEAFYNFIGMAGMTSAAHYAGKANGMSDAQMISNLESMGFKRDMATSITENVKKANDFRIGKSIMDGRFGQFYDDIVTGMDASKRAGYKSNAYQAEEVKKMTERMQSPEGIANIRDYQTEQHQKIGEEYVAKMERAQKFLSEDGTAYSQIKQSGQKVPASGIVKDFLGILERNGLGIDSEGNVYRMDTTKAKGINQTDVSNINQLFQDMMGDVKRNGKAVDSNGEYSYLDATQTLNARSTASKKSKYDAATTADGTKVMREIRGAIDRNAKEHLVGLKELDKNYADRLNAMNDALLDLVYKQGGQKGDWRSNFFNIVSTLDRANRAKLAERMEKVLPGITKRVQAINNLREIHTALTNTKLMGRAPLFTGIAMGYHAGGKMFPVLGHVFGAGAGAVLGLLGENMITKLRARAIESIVGKMSDKAIAEIRAIREKRMKGIRLTEREREVVQKARDAIEKESQRIKAEENIRRIREKHAKDKERKIQEIMDKMFPQEAPMLEAPKTPAGTSVPLPRNAPEAMAAEGTGFQKAPVSDIAPQGKLETAKIDGGKVVYPEQQYNKPKTPIIDLEGLKPEPPSPKGLPPEGEGGIPDSAPKTPIIDLEGLKPEPPTAKPEPAPEKSEKPKKTPKVKKASKEKKQDSKQDSFESKLHKEDGGETEIGRHIRIMAENSKTAEEFIQKMRKTPVTFEEMVDEARKNGQGIDILETSFKRSTEEAVNELQKGVSDDELISFFQKNNLSGEKIDILNPFGDESKQTPETKEAKK